MVRNQRDNNDILAPAFTVTNWTNDLDFDANTATLGVTSDVLATLIKHLIELGIINGTVSA